MKKKLLSLMLVMLNCMMVWSADGDIFTASTVEGVLMRFCVISESSKTCMVYNPESSKPAISKETVGEITIPEFVNGYQVTEIGPSAFRDCTEITNINIPSSIVYINSGALGSTKWYKDLVDELSDGPIYIGNVLYGYKNPESMTDGTSIVIKEGTTGISDNFLFYCSNLGSVTIPSSVKKIGQGAFGWSGISSLTFLSSDVYIMGDSFYNCSHLSEINVPLGFSGRIGKNVFKGTLWYSSQEDGLVNIGKVILGYKGDMPLNVEIVIPEGASAIADNAFYNCANLSTVKIPQSVKSIGISAFSGCNLSNIVLPQGMTYMGQSAFYGCKNLTSAIINEGIDIIDGNVFYGCSSLEEIHIPKSVKTIGMYAFKGCSSLINVSFSNGISCLNSCAFMNCSSLTSITLPNSLTIIGPEVFAYCTSLASVTIPSNVNSIGSWAFDGCNNLTSVACESKIPVSIDEYTFSNSANATLYVPVGSKPAYETADNWKNFGIIKEMLVDITIGTAGIGTYCSSHALDFSNTDDIKAYIVSAFKPSTGEVTLTRISDVPANTGIIVKGDADTYSVPWGSGETLVSNMLVGVTENTVLNKEDGENTNYILAKKNGVLGFYAVTDGSTLSAGKAYLPLPTASLPSGAREMKLVFDDEETTGIKETINNCESVGKYYDLQGRYIAKPTHGLYIVNGKKVIIK